MDQTGYVVNESGQFKCKSKVVTRTVRDEAGLPVEIREKVVCYWSKRFYDRELRENETFLQTLQMYIDNPSLIKREKANSSHSLTSMPSTNKPVNSKNREK